MGFGSNGTILRVDLTRGETKVRGRVVAAEDGLVVVDVGPTRDPGAVARAEALLQASRPDGDRAPRPPGDSTSPPDDDRASRPDGDRASRPPGDAEPPPAP